MNPFVAWQAVDVATATATSDKAGRYLTYRLMHKGSSADGRAIATGRKTSNVTANSTA
jgi:hypothetical protein